MAHLAEGAALLGATLAFGVLPVDWASAAGGFLARKIGPRLGVSRHALRNLARAMPENSEAENRQILLGMWDNLGRTIAEYPHLRWICAARSGRVEIVNRQCLTEAGAGPRLLFGGHLANWEIAPVTLHPLLGPSLRSVYRAANNPFVDRLLQRLRGSPPAIPKGGEGSREMLRHLRDGGQIAMYVDQKMNDGIAVPFFGRNAPTAPALARLARRFSCPILPVRVERLGGARFQLTALPALAVAKTGDAAVDVDAAMRSVNALMEGWIRHRPEQWLWIHRRWADEAAPS